MNVFICIKRQCVTITQRIVGIQGRIAERLEKEANVRRQHEWVFLLVYRTSSFDRIPARTELTMNVFVQNEHEPLKTKERAPHQYKKSIKMIDTVRCKTKNPFIY